MGLRLLNPDGDDYFVVGGCRDSHLAIRASCFVCAHDSYLLIDVALSKYFDSYRAICGDDDDDDCVFSFPLLHAYFDYSSFSSSFFHAPFPPALYLPCAVDKSSLLRLSLRESVFLY
jgi:hypothetical protein